jgi:predicted nucleic acid-binding Zn ribbon protein
MDKMKNILTTVIQRMASQQTLPADRMQRLWASIVEAKTASHTRVADFKNGVLVIYADTPGWAYQLKTQRLKLAARLQEEIPEFKQLVVKIGKVA